MATGKEAASSTESKTTQVADLFNDERRQRLKGWNRLMWWGFGLGLGLAGVAAILATNGLATPWVVNTLYALGASGVSLGTVGAGGGIVESASPRRKPKTA